MMIEDEKFFAWLDGELEGTEAADMEAKVAADQQLARLAQRHRALKTRLNGAFDPIASAPVPERLRKAVGTTPNVIDFASAKRARRMPSLPEWTALAATLAVGVFVGTMVPRQASGPLEVQGGKIYAASSLNQALSTQLAGGAASDVRIGLTFRDHAGEICRSFTQDASSGLACRDGRRWQVKGMFAAPEGQGGDYRMAAGMDPNLAALVDSSMVGEPFDGTAERAAMRKGWR